MNGKYCASGKEVKPGDRIGIFPKKMGLIFVEISKNNSISITAKFFANLRKYGPPKELMDVPEGSTIKTILNKYQIPKKMNLIILVNGRPNYDRDQVLKNGDVVAVFPPLAGG